MKRTILGLALLLIGAGSHGAVSAVPHSNNAVAKNEHEAMMDLVRVAEATATAVRSGPWSVAATWKEGRAPAAGAIVVIPPEIVVTLEREAGAMRAVRVGGRCGGTRRPLWQKYGLAVGGAVAPAYPAPAPRVHGLLGSPAQYGEDLRLETIRTTQAGAFQTVCIGAQNKAPPWPKPISGRAGT